MNAISTDLSVDLAGLSLRNPVLVASGTYGAGLEADDLGVALNRIGGVVTKSVTTKPRRGNPPPRIWETEGGMLNSIGIMQGGVDAFRRDTLPRFAELDCARVVNVAGESVEDFVALCRAFSEEAAVDALELNVSCPNVSGGLDFATDPALLEPLVAACREAWDRPLFVKLSPNVSDIGVIAAGAERGGADALSLVNTFRGMAIDWRKRRPILGSPTGAGGLSGPAVKPMALWAVNRVRECVKLPLIGIGGIRGPEDVLEFVVTGCSAIQVGTANFLDPHAPVRIADGLSTLLQAEGISSITPLVGSLKARSQAPETH